VKTGFRVSGCTRLALGLGLATLLGCGPEPVDGEPFVDPSRGPLYMPGAGTGGSSSADTGSPAPGGSAETSTTLSDSQDKPVCCKLCLQGKACGDSCIAAELACQAGPGCACDT
jgi:hypothetical protein